jgi:hypothetical protein
MMTSCCEGKDGSAGSEGGGISAATGKLGSAGSGGGGSAASIGTSGRTGTAGSSGGSSSTVGETERNVGSAASGGGGISAANGKLDSSGSKGGGSTVAIGGGERGLIFSWLFGCLRRLSFRFWRLLWLNAGAWGDMTSTDRRTLSGILCNRLRPTPHLYIVGDWLGRSFRWSWLGYNGRMHHSFSARCGDPTQSEGSKHSKLMHALAISPNLLIRLAKKSDAEEVPRQFAL